MGAATLRSACWANSDGDLSAASQIAAPLRETPSSVVPPVVPNKHKGLERDHCEACASTSSFVNKIAPRLTFSLAFTHPACLNKVWFIIACSNSFEQAGQSPTYVTPEIRSLTPKRVSPSARNRAPTSCRTARVTWVRDFRCSFSTHAPAAARPDSAPLASASCLCSRARGRACP